MTVVVAVYNTMPYLTTCLNSLVEQSIGAERMEVVAVDDGSTDGSGDELDRFAAEYPDVVTVLRQPNSGGPASPSNRALDVATGRYVYFVGADDHLGPEALERMVAAADEWGSDVLVGKMEGVNGRAVRKPELFAENRSEIDLYDSVLPWVLSNCKLFRRDLVERHKLRFRENMRIGSDQPFTLEACVRAERISVLADYTCYYAVLRDDGGNITQGAVDVYTRLECAESLFGVVAGLLEPGPERDAILTRHTRWELTMPTREGFLELDRDAQEDVCARVGKLVEEYVTDDVLYTLPIIRRARLRLAQLGQVDLLCEAIQAAVDERSYPIAVKDGRTFLAYQGFDDPALGLLDELFEITKGMRKRLSQEVRTVRAQRDGDTVEVTVRTPFTGPGAEDPAVVRFALAPRGGKERVHLDEAAVTREPGEDGMRATVRIPVALLAGSPRHDLRLLFHASGETHDVAVPAELPGASGDTVWHRARPYRLSVRGDERGTVIETRPVRPARAVAGRIRRVTSLGGK
ncbi:glycosyltransferase family 2 protein [Actinomadura darangshiensis]|uniref:glycosyltransferase family 2 protein n=1 Tax=Actinomadura darangshiensis TaxID=705336 RepID=UPI001A9D8FDA|nr:glycosyltransferase [Actinomadura darangshiensis]